MSFKMYFDPNFVIAALVTLLTCFNGASPGAEPAIQTFRANRTIRALTEALRSGAQIEPCTLGAADLDGDGVAELLCGFRGSAGGVLSVHRGNSAASFPGASTARIAGGGRRAFVQPFLSSPRIESLVFAPDFIAAGDLDGDGATDVVLAERGSNQFTLYIYHNGRLTPARVRKFAGRITALASGEVNRRDGLSDLVVAIDGPDGAQLQVFEGPFGALNREPEVFELPVPATSFVLANLDEDYLPDIAAACGSRLILIHGRDRKLSLDAETRGRVPAATLNAHELDFSIADMTAANLVADKRCALDLGLLTADGEVILARLSANQIERKNLSKDEPALAGIQNGRIIRFRSLAQPMDDLAIINPANGEALIYNYGANKLAQIAAPGARKIAALRLNEDTLDDLVLLGDGEYPILYGTPAPIAVITVNSAGSGLLHDDFMTFDQAIDTVNNGTNMFYTPEELAQISGTPGGNGLHEIRFDDLAVSPAIITVTQNNITRPVFINGVSHPGFVANERPTIILSGSYNVLGGSSLIRAITQISGRILLDDNPGDTIERCVIGTDDTGEFAGGAGTDIEISPNSIGLGDPNTNHQLGGTAAATLNVIGQRVIIQENANSNFLFNNQCGLSLQGRVITEDQERILVQSSNNVIGQQGNPGGNVIVGGQRRGIFIDRRTTTAQMPEFNVIQNNLIGIDANGNGGGDYANLFAGIELDDVGMTTIGGSMAIFRNVISGNQFGIVAKNGALVAIQGNLIGVNPFTAPTTPTLGNELVGVILENCRFSALGGIVALGKAPGPTGADDPLVGAPPGNIISGNGNDGVDFSINTTTCVLQGNLIGLLADGSPAGNGGDGFEMSTGCQDNVIGGIELGSRNIISDNGFSAGQPAVFTGNGIRIRGENVANNRIQNNFIGTDPTGTIYLGNNQHTVVIREGAHNNLIGGAIPGALNVISGGGDNFIPGHGVYIQGPLTHSNIVDGNNIGTDLSGFVAIPNTGYGVVIQDRTTSNVIGGAGRNIISGNGTPGPFSAGGVLIDGMDSSNSTYGNQLVNNYIGVNPTGAKLTNFGSGVEIVRRARNNVVGKIGLGNVISGNGDAVFAIDGHGIFIGGESLDNIVQGNLIGLDDSGTTAVGNFGYGILIENSRNNLIGGLQPGELNAISGNTSGGLALSRVNPTTVSADRNQIIGNLIGVGVDGATPISNEGHGVLLEGGAGDNTIGPGNTIAFNGDIVDFIGAGVVITGDSDGNKITGNSIFGNLLQAIDLGNDGPTANDQFDNDANGSPGGPNDLQNFPVVTMATATSAEGTYHSIPNRRFIIEVFAGAGEQFFTGAGEAQTFLGSDADVMTNGQGNAAWNVTNIVVPPGQPFITATATDVTVFGTPPNTITINNTSEVSSATQAQGVPTLDFGDAPDPTYPTLLSSDGARHQILQNYYLGAGVDNDANGQPNAQASGDDDNGSDDEDGVTFPASLIIGTSVMLTVQASLNGGAGMLDAFVDFNADGDWNDAGEKVFDSVALSEGLNQLQLSIPANATSGPTFARFRLSVSGGLSPSGLAASGEIEDYRIRLDLDDVQQQLTLLLQQLLGTPNNEDLDLNGDGVEDIADIIFAVNLLNARGGKVAIPEAVLTKIFGGDAR